jgi:hypothetical protein
VVETIKGRVESECSTFTGVSIEGVSCECVLCHFLDEVSRFVVDNFKVILPIFPKFFM